MVGHILQTILLQLLSYVMDKIQDDTQARPAERT